MMRRRRRTLPAQDVGGTIVAAGCRHRHSRYHHPLQMLHVTRITILLLLLLLLLVGIQHNQPVEAVINNDGLCALNVFMPYTIKLGPT